MEKTDIQKRIYELQNDDEIIGFVKSRIAELENNSIESTVGQGYTDFKNIYQKKRIIKLVLVFEILNVLILFMMILHPMFH